MCHRGLALKPGGISSIWQGLPQRRHSWEIQRKLLPFENWFTPGNLRLWHPFLFPLSEVMTTLMVCDNGQKGLIARECCAGETILFKALLESMYACTGTGFSSTVLLTHPSSALTVMHELSHLGMSKGQMFYVQQALHWVSVVPRTTCSMWVRRSLRLYYNHNWNTLTQ